MRCSACGYESLSGKKFCGECGAALKLKCSSCGGENTPGTKFCGDCGNPLAEAAKQPPPREPRSYTPKHLAEKILTSRSALEGERKQVTVLFADVKGSMELAEQLDPEEWHRSWIASSRSCPTVFTASRARSTSTPATASWRCSVRRSRTRITRSALATRRSTCARRCARYADELRVGHGHQLRGAHGPQFGRGRGRQDRRRPADGLHGAGAHGRPGGADGADRRGGDSSYLTEHTAKLVSGYFQLRDLGATRRSRD